MSCDRCGEYIIVGDYFRKGESMFERLDSFVLRLLFGKESEKRTPCDEAEEKKGVNYTLTSVFPSKAAMEAALKARPYNS